MKKLKNILYAIDLDDDRITSIVFALEFAEYFNSRIHFVYVNDPQAGYRHPTDREDAVALKVRQSAPAALWENQDLVYAALKGQVAEEIIRYADEHQIDLIMVGHKHRSRVYSSMFDSTDVNIVDASRLPVLVLPEEH